MKRLWTFVRGSVVLTAALACTDRNPPEVVITSPEPWSTVSGSVIIKVDVTDAPPIESVSFFIDNSSIAQDSVAPWEYEWNTLEWADGAKHKIACVAIDASGKEYFPEFVMVYVILPSNRPITSYAPWGPGEDQSPDTALTFFGTGTDPDGDSISFQFDWGDGSFSPWTGYVPSGDTISYQKSYSNEGTFLIKVRVKDTYGVTSNWSPEDSLRISKYGKLKWRCNLGEPVISSPALGYDGTIYVGTEHYLHAINPNGTIKWSYEVDPWRVYSSPAVGSDGTIYFGCYYYYLYALNPDGTLKWRYETEWRIESSPAIGSDGTIYFGTYDSSLCAITPQGTLKWKYKVGSIIKSSPGIGYDGTIYCGCNNDYLYAITPTGALKWRYKTKGEITSSPAIGSDGSVYFTCWDSYLYAISNEGIREWSAWIGDHPNTSLTVGQYGIIYVVRSGNLFILTSAGEQKWGINADFGYSFPTVGADGIAYLGATDGSIFALNTSGLIQWKYKIEAGIFSSLALDNNGLLYIGDNDSYLYAITTSSQGLCNSSWPKFRHDNQNTGRFGGP